MTKLDLIQNIIQFDANLVWELDKPEYYALISWCPPNSSYWVEHLMEDTNKKVLQSLLIELKKLKTVSYEL